MPVANGGTGAATASGARTNLGAAAASHTHDASTDLTGQVPITNGGTGASTAAAALTALGAASQDDMDDAEQAIADNAAAIATLGESVNYFFKVENNASEVKCIRIAKWSKGYFLVLYGSSNAIAWIGPFATS